MGLMNAATTGTHPSQNIPSAWRGEYTTLGIREGVSEKIDRRVPTQTDEHLQPLMLHPAQVGNTHNFIICPQGKLSDLKDESILDPNEHPSI